MTILHNLGFPRIGVRRELKKVLESYWRQEIDRPALLDAGRQLRRRHWRIQADAGMDWVPVGDFSWYDHVLDLSALLGVVPRRFQWPGGEVDLDIYFRMARGGASGGDPVAACEMTKWFDTNYHYLVPEFEKDQSFKLSSNQLFDEVDEAIALGYKAKPVLLGPLSYLWLGKARGGGFETLALLESLLPVYGEILLQLRARGVEWVQLDEPILALDLPLRWRDAFESAYNRLQLPGLNKMLAVYFGPLQDNLPLACRLPVEGLHIDAVRGAREVGSVLSGLPGDKVLSVGIVDGRNIWRADPDVLLSRLQTLRAQLGDRLWLAPSCSLLHVPVDLAQEQQLDSALRSWLAFAVQKLAELKVLQEALDNGVDACAEALLEARRAIDSRRHSPHIHKAEVKQRCAELTPQMAERNSPYDTRIAQQHARFQLPLLPTTTIGSFPQTAGIRQARRDHKQGRMTEAEYQARMRTEIDVAINRQERIGLDVLVHGEPERNDMVEYFGEQLDGIAISQFGWVQSYGSRCVKPPIIYGDVSRPRAMTVSWSRYAQSKTAKPVKGMLTGPVTMLNWSFVRDDRPRSATCLQLALALRDEVCDLEQAGIGIIQIDEAALREGLPLRDADRQRYLDWAVHAFRVASSGVADETQIHTHMCYSEFNDIMPAIAAMDADVITIETSRSAMALLEAFEHFEYPNDIGPGLYDVHSPDVPTIGSMNELIEKALRHIPVERLWVNPDCGLKTRGWPEVEKALVNMVCTAVFMRSRFDPVRAG